MKRIVNTYTWSATLAEFQASEKVFEAGSILIVEDQPSAPILVTENGTFADQQGKIDGPVKNHSLVAVNATATGTAAQILAGGITSTSAAAVAYTLPTGALLGAAANAARGTWLDFAVDNSVGANTVTVTPSTGITAATAVITGGATLTVAATAVGLFRIYFLTTTTAVIYRIG